MHKITYNDKSYSCEKDETVLDVFLRNGVEIPFSCRSGICHVCLLRATDGVIPEESQQGLKQHLQNLNYFKACKCVPDGDMALSSARSEDMLVSAVVAQKEMITPSICRLLLEPATHIKYHSGQFINLKNSDGDMRSYSLASVPGEDYFLELQVKKVENGLFSHWIFNRLKEGDEVELQGPEGESYYQDDNPRQPILLLGTGTGLSPLIGIARDALSKGHIGEIHLYHGARYADELYLDDELNTLAKKYNNFYYHGCLTTDADISSIYKSGRVQDIALNEHSNLSGWKVFCLFNHLGITT